MPKTIPTQKVSRRLRDLHKVRVVVHLESSSDVDEMIASLPRLDVVGINYGPFLEERESVERLIAVLPQCPSLAKLDLKNAGYGNRIGDESLALLAAVLPQLPLLKSLNLSLNEFGDEGMGRLAAVLGQCPSLADLRLGDIGHVTDVGIQRLAGVLPQCTSLTHLLLKGHSGFGFETPSGWFVESTRPFSVVIRRRST